MIKRCVVTQPLFLPWLGWFDIALQADAVVLLDTVQFEKRSWQQRNRIRTGLGLQLITIPVITSGRFSQRILDVELAEPSTANILLRTLECSYGGAPFFQPVLADLEAALREAMRTNRLVDMNIALIQVLARWLRVGTPILRASNMLSTGRRGEYLAELCSEVGASVYLSTVGAEEYLRKDITQFTKRGIKVLLHQYVHPEYQQMHEPFMSHASALDLIMMTGPRSAEVLRSSHGKWLEIEPLKEAP